MNEKSTSMAFDIILHSGNAKSSAMEALYESRDGNPDDAIHKLVEAKKELVEAHQRQTKLLQDEIRGDSTDVNVVLCHAMDHMAMAITTIELAEEIILLRKEMKEIKKED